MIWVYVLLFGLLFIVFQNYLIYILILGVILLVIRLLAILYWWGYDEGIWE